MKQIKTKINGITPRPIFASALFASGLALCPGCSNLADNPILMASAVHPNNWVARAVLFSSIQKKDEERNELAKLYSKEPDKLAKDEAIKLAQAAEEKNYFDAAMKYWLIAATKGEYSGYHRAGIINESSRRFEEAYKCYVLAAEFGIKNSSAKAASLEKNFSAEKLAQLKSEANSIRKGLQNRPD